MSSTEQVFANEIAVGDVIVCASGDSITVESVVRDGDFIDFTGKQTSHSYLGNEDREGGMYGAFWDDLVTIISRGQR